MMPPVTNSRGRRMSVRRESRTLTGRFRGGKLAPVMATVLRESESCILSQSCTFETDPIAGRMITPITVELISVNVPVQAIDAIKNPESAYAGNTEVIRDKLLSGTPLFGLETEGELSKRMGVRPRSIGGVKKVNEVVRLAHNAAVNYLRTRKYLNAVKILAANTGVTPALIGQTVLDRLNAVLDPEDRVNGSVMLDIGTMNLPVSGIGAGTAGFAGGGTFRENDGQAVAYPSYLNGGTANGVAIRTKTVGGNKATDVFAVLNGAAAGSVSLTDFYNAEKMDELTRMMREMIEANPEYGEEMVQRWAHGLTVDSGKVPYVIHESSQILGQTIVPATDTTGVNTDVMRSDLSGTIRFTVPVGSSELGSVIITFATLKPDEAMVSQPHPFLSDVWGATNFVSAELERDPVAVTMREVDSTIASGSEATVAFYTGHNELKRAYINYGFNGHIDLTTVASKTAIWQLGVPMSVTPESILYPESLSHYPFADQNAEVCTYTISSVQTVNTPLVFGPTPVEELAVIETENLFEDNV